MSTAPSNIRPAQEKNAFIAFLLVFLLGPIGAIYLSFKDAAIYFVIALVLGVATGGIGFGLVWLGYLVAVFPIASSYNAEELRRYNAEVEAERKANYDRYEEKLRHEQILAALSKADKNGVDVTLES